MTPTRTRPAPLPPGMVLLTLATLLNGCEVGGRRPMITDPFAGEITLPTRDCGDLFVVDALLNGQGPFTLVVDTGATGLPLAPRAIERLWPGAKMPSRLESVRIGEFVVRDLHPTRQTFEAVEAALGEPLDGIVGYNVFRDVLLTYDFPARQLRVRRGRLAPDAPHTMRYIADPRPFLPLRIGKLRTQALLDTGATRGLNVPKIERFRTAAPPVALHGAATVRGGYVATSGRLLDNVEWGPLQLSQPIVNSRNKNPIVVGCRILRDFVLTFDQANRLVRFEGPVEEPMEFKPVRDTGAALVPHDDGLRVAAIVPGSPAEAADVRVGDIVTALDGRSVAPYDCEVRNWRHALGDELTAIRFTIRRDGVLRDVDLKLAALVE